mmetsp:Transcript_8524/g.35110  ORF Transcript_8524/g.35110 Transcript_8524/m.35110 type:complete len:340 (+) Transcript_8524:236-1255(+)
MPFQQKWATVPASRSHFAAAVVLCWFAFIHPTVTALTMSHRNSWDRRPGAPETRRGWLGTLAGAGLAQVAGGLHQPASAIIAGAPVSVKEAAASGSVALWIDLDGCEVCRHDVPAACSGTLVGPRLVLSAQHCIDIPESLNGRLSRVGFGNDIFDDRTIQFRDVERYVRPGDVGLSLPGAGSSLANDLVLIKLKKPAPPEWNIAAIDLASSAAEEDAPPAKNTVVELYGFGDTVDDPDGYSAGELRKVRLAAVTPLTVDVPAFYTKARSGDTGSCNGDSGGAAFAASSSSRPPRILGVLSSNTMPCAGSRGIFMNPAYFREFLRRGAQELGEEPPAILS